MTFLRISLCEARRYVTALLKYCVNIRKPPGPNDICTLCSSNVFIKEGFLLHCSFTVEHLSIWRPQLYIHTMLTKHKHLEMPQAHARLLFAHFPSTSNNISSERGDLFLLGKSGYLILHAQVGACSYVWGAYVQGFFFSPSTKVSRTVVLTQC